MLLLTLTLLTAAAGPVPVPNGGPAAGEGRLSISIWPDFWTNEELIGDPGGWRSYSAERGIDLRGTIVSETFAVAAGGLDRGLSQLNGFDLQAEFDLDELTRLIDARALIRVDAFAGRSISKDVGDLQGTSDLDEYDRASLRELWYAFEPRTGFGFRAGKIDARRDFARIASAADFLHRSAGLSERLLPFPGDPLPAVGLTTFTQVGAFRVAVGAFDAADPQDGHGPLTDPARGFSMGFDEHLLLAEFEYDWARNGSAAVGKLALGFWNHTGTFTGWRGTTNSGQEGLYLLGEQEVWRGRGVASGHGPSLKMLGQLTLADDEVFAIERHLAAGVRLDGASKRRPRDSTGAWLSLADLTGVPQAELSGVEIALELYHRFQWTPAIALTPDAQWIIEPAGREKDALVVGLRVEIDL